MAHIDKQAWCFGSCLKSIEYQPLIRQFQESTESVEARVRAWNSKKRFSLAAASPCSNVGAGDKKTYSLRRIIGKNNSGGEGSKSAPRTACPVASAQEEQELFQPHCQVCMKFIRMLAVKL